MGQAGKTLSQIGVTFKQALMSGHSHPTSVVIRLPIEPLTSIFHTSISMDDAPMTNMKDWVKGKEKFSKEAVYSFVEPATFEEVDQNLREIQAARREGKQIDLYFAYGSTGDLKHTYLTNEHNACMRNCTEDSLLQDLHKWTKNGKHGPGQAVAEENGVIYGAPRLHIDKKGVKDIVIPYTGCEEDELHYECVYERQPEA